MAGCWPVGLKVLRKGLWLASIKQPLLVGKGVKPEWAGQNGRWCHPEMRKWVQCFMSQDLAAQSLQGTTKCSMLILLHCSEGKMQRQIASRKVAVPWRVDVSTSPCIWAPPGRLPVSEKSLAHFKNQDLGSFWASHWKRQARLQEI